MALTCCGKNWANLEARGSKRERATFECETIYAAPPTLEFVNKGNIELYECHVKFWNYFGFIWPFYTLIEFLDFQCA